MEPKILWESADALFVIKPVGIPSQPDPSGRPDLLTALAATRPGVRLVHRLDTPTGGVMMYAKTPKAATHLSAQVQDHETCVKEYLCVLPAAPEPSEGEMTDYLYHDRRANRSFTVPPPAEVDKPRAGVKAARLTYRTLAVEPGGEALVRVRLYTGRTHQIRVQFASRGLPLLGDGKYGSRVKLPGIALWSYRLTVRDPATGKPLCLSALPDEDIRPWSDFSPTEYPTL